MAKKNSFFTVILLAGALLFTPIHTSYCFAAEGDVRQDKKDCVAISDQEVKGVLTKLSIPQAKILSITESPIKGLCEIVIDNMGRLGVFYLAIDKKYLLLGSLIEVADMSDMTRESVKKIQDKKRIDITKIPVNEALILGERGASRKVIVFTDPDCPFCGQLHETMKKIVLQRKDIAFYIKFLPLEIHKDAYWKAQSIVCNKSLKMLEDNFAKKDIPRPECTTEEIDKSMKLALSFGISGTPSLILPDGRIREGAMPEAYLIDLIDGKK